MILQRYIQIIKVWCLWGILDFFDVERNIDFTLIWKIKMLMNMNNENKNENGNVMNIIMEKSQKIRYEK